MARQPLPPSTTRSPSQEYKLLIIDILRKAIEKDIELDKEGYSQAVKQILRLLKPYASNEILEEIKKIKDEMDKEIEKIKNNKKLSDQNKEAKIKKVVYDYTDRMAEYITDILYSSTILQREMEGMIKIEKLEDLFNLSKEIKKPIKVEFLERVEENVTQ